MLLDGKTVLVTGVGVGLGRECAASALRDGANVVLAARRKDELAECGGRARPWRPAQCAPGHRHHRCRLLCGLRPTRAGTVWLGRRPHPGRRVRACVGWPLRPEPRRLAGGVRYQRARRADAPAAGGEGHEGERRGLGRLHRLAVDVQAGHASGRLRRLQGRPVDHDLLPGGRARTGQHPLQHGDPVVDVGAERPAVCVGDGSTTRTDRRGGLARVGRPTSRCGG